MSITLARTDEASPPRASRATFAAIAVLVLLKLWLSSNRAMTAIGPAGHDDHLYLNMAKGLVSGQWLGAYNHMTLTKGPFYSIWIAATFGLGVPLPVAQHLLYAAACAVFVSALAPVFRGALARIALFAVLFFNPSTFTDGVGTRVLREGIYPALTLLVLGCALAIPLRSERPFRSNASWAVGLGTGLAALWLCREESIWIVPALFLVALWVVVQRSSSRRTVILLGAGAATIFVALVGAVVVKNWWNYGVPVITEFTEGQFPGAYAALGRVSHAAERPRIPLPQETRLRIYAVSPRFAELRPFMEGDIGRAWSKPGCVEAGICGDIAAGWLMWALRDAAAAAGHYRDARAAGRYWAGVRDEVASACREGRLACGGLSLGFLPPLRRAHLEALPGTFLRAVASVASFQDMTVHPSPSVGPDWLLVDFRDLTRARLAPIQIGADPAVPHQDRLAARQEKVLGRILAAYRRLTPLLALAALGAFVGSVAASIRRRQPGALPIVAAVLLAATASRIAVLTLVHVTTFPALSIVYLAPAYALLLAFIVVALASACEAVQFQAAVARPAAPAPQGKRRPRADGEAS